MKFIVTGMPRTGTTVVCGSLLTHPELLCYGELFHDNPGIRQSEAQRTTMGAGWKFDKSLGWGVDAPDINQPAQPYLEKFFSANVPAKAVGFKVLFHQVTQGPNCDVWEFIANDPEIRIIRMKRENLLEIICSYVRASMTRTWHNTGGITSKPNRYIIPADQCEVLFRKFTAVPEAMRNVETTHKVFHVEYTNICHDFQSVMNGIEEFLEVSKRDNVRPYLQKIAMLRPDEELANYQELKRHFSKSQYAEHFLF